MSALLSQAFRTAVSELGMASAAWLFASETAEHGGNEALASLRDDLGREWPVLDMVCAAAQRGHPQPEVDVSPLAPEWVGVERLVLVGYESAWVDVLLPALPAHLRVALVQHGDPLTDWDRLVANHNGRLELLPLADFQTWAGARSVLMTWVYGHSARQVFVLPAWLRVTGPDVRLQFRHLLGWQIVDLPMDVYPRWLVAAEVDVLTELRPHQPGTLTAPAPVASPTASGVPA
jgi:hypothetical protein